MVKWLTLIIVGDEMTTMTKVWLKTVNSFTATHAYNYFIS